jgi:hypothetical protein
VPRVTRVATRGTGRFSRKQYRPLGPGGRADERVEQATQVSPVQRWPVYSLPVIAAALLALHSTATATVEDLPRPLLIVLAVALLMQILLSAILRSRHAGAYATLCLGLFLLDWPIAGAVLAAVPLCFALAAWIMRRARSRLPWPRVTEFLNIFGLVTLGLAVTSSWSGGSLVPLSRTGVTSSVAGTGPDIYVILLDGHPRGDTMEADFDLDSSQFLGPLQELGFEVVHDARANYNFTALTLASLFNMAQVRSITSLDARASPPAQFRQLARAINTGSVLDEFRKLGYEIVTVPSPAGVTSLHTADRMTDDGSITQFEFEILESGLNPKILPDVQRSLVMGSMRARVQHSLEATVALAEERGGRPKFVFTHVMSPHAPLLFTDEGAPIDGWPCYPDCSVFDFGWRYGDEGIQALAGQIRYLDVRVVETVKGILAASEEPPVIVLLSDHGGRHHPDDHAEMLRSLLVISTPGKAGIFREDASLVTVFPRLLNAYFNAGLELSSEESYYIDLSDLLVKGPLDFEPIDPQP